MCENKKLFLKRHVTKATRLHKGTRKAAQAKLVSEPKIAYNARTTRISHFISTPRVRLLGPLRVV